MQKLYKDVFENVYLDKKNDEIILNETIYKKNNLIYKRVILTIILIVLVTFVSFGVVYAGEIIEKIKSSFITTTIDYTDNDIQNNNIIKIKIESQKSISENATFNDITSPLTDNQHTITFTNLTEELDISILTNRIYDTELVRIIKLEKSNDKISYASFAIDDVYVSNDGSISMSFEFITNYYEDDYFMVTVGSTRNIEKVYQSIETSEKFATDLYFWSPVTVKDENEMVSTMIVIFVYDNVVYKLYGTDVSKIDLINNLDYYN